MRNQLPYALVALTTPLALAAPARADSIAIEGQVQYVGAHPIAARADAGFCHIDFPHVHTYKPPRKARVLYRVRDGHHHFVGDPVGLGYEGPSHSYYGHHPVAVEVVVGAEPAYAEGQPLEYCYLTGPHYHRYEPPPGLTFEVKAGAHWYVGDFGPRYRKHRRRYVRVNAYYEPIVYERPAIVVDAPPVGYVGPFVEVHAHGHAGAPPVHAGVSAEVEVHVPTPSLSVEWGLSGVVADDHHHHRKHRKVKRRKHKHRKVKHRKVKHRRFKHRKVKGHRWRRGRH